MYGLAAVHYLGIAVTMFAYFFVTRTFVWPLTNDIKQVLAIEAIQRGAADDKLRAVAWKFERFSAEVVNQALVQTLVASVFGLFPYVQRLASCKSIPWQHTSD